MNDHSYLDIAARAANLAERARVVAALRAAGTAAVPGVLPAFDAWKIDRLAGKLAARYRREAPRRTGPARHTKDEIAGAPGGLEIAYLAATGAEADHVAGQ